METPPRPRRRGARQATNRLLRRDRALRRGDHRRRAACPGGRPLDSLAAPVAVASPALWRCSMLTILGPKHRFCDGISRRNFLQIGGLALGGLSMSDIL